MTQHLSDKDINRVVKLLDSWDKDKKLTWESFCNLIMRRLGLQYSRKTLSGKVRIADAFKNKKSALKGKAPRKTPQSLNVAAARIETLENENKRLESENNRLLEQFLTWQYNATAHGVTVEQLNMEIPSNRKARNISES